MGIALYTPDQIRKIRKWADYHPLGAHGVKRLANELNVNYGSLKVMISRVRRGDEPAYWQFTAKEP